MRTEAIGLDIGGANLKAADATGRSLCRPFELWRLPERLSDELARIRDEWPNATTVAVTMTGELCDCFETKRDGVRHILAAVMQVFGDRPIGVWSTDGDFMSPTEAASSPIKVASANWHAQATYAGRFVPTGAALLVDTGSTTTDVIPLMDGRVIARGRTDSERLESSELVYTGIRRTPLCAILGAGVAAELFATTLDAYLLLGLTPEDPHNRSTADARPATRRFAHARMARMIGGDCELTSESETLAIAQQVLAIQSRLIASAMGRVTAQMPAMPERVIVSGSGTWLAEQAFEVWSAVENCFRLACPESACAYAVAVLCAEI